MLKISSLLAVVASVAVAHAAFAVAPPTPTYTFMTDAPSYVGAVGSTVDVKVFLVETAPAGSVINAEGGVYSSGGKVTRDSSTGNGTSTLANILPNTAEFTDPFHLTADTALPTIAALWEDATYPDVVMASAQGAEPYTVFLGTVPVTVTAGAPTTFTITTYQYDGTWTNTGIDTLENRFAPFTDGSFTVTATPEPASLGLLGVGALLLLRRRR